MGRGRLEAFSDGVLAIIITIMVLELKTPAQHSLAALHALWPTFVGYALSFVYVGIYWNNHHHLVHALRRINGQIMWANLHLLFWLSLFPFMTAWAGQSGFAAGPMALYGAVLFLAGMAYQLLQRCILASEGCDSVLARAVGRDGKGVVSQILYLLGICLAWYWPWASGLLYSVVALIWLVPDRRIARALARADLSDQAGK
ncbi:TMEM175 family protein [Paludibacterium purpuratum]|uniref:Putative membrane protein n=1 Tax=Paludibacterium purpuratum TaxID=1144873 RepID=A0A4R7B286_9NEIS|nr:TMEM175 family protein [Paludibacterium purpuratum]TDR73868.1 putative membrane protein [Paludibacterium purpuratum]